MRVYTVAVLVCETHLEMRHFPTLEKAIQEFETLIDNDLDSTDVERTRYIIQEALFLHKYITTNNDKVWIEMGVLEE